MNYNFEFYKLKITNKNCKSFVLKESYIPKKWYYKWIIEEINKRKKEFLFNWMQNKKEYFDEYDFFGMIGGNNE